MTRSKVPLDAIADREERRRKQLETPVGEIGLDVRISEALEQHGVLLLGDLLRLQREDLLAIGIPPYRVDWMLEMLREVGLRLIAD